MRDESRSYRSRPRALLLLFAPLTSPPQAALPRTDPFLSAPQKEKEPLGSESITNIALSLVFGPKFHEYPLGRCLQTAAMGDSPRRSPPAATSPKAVSPPAKSPSPAGVSSVPAGSPAPAGVSSPPAESPAPANAPSPPVEQPALVADEVIASPPGKPLVEKVSVATSRWGGKLTIASTSTRTRTTWE